MEDAPQNGGIRAPARPMPGACAEAEARLEQHRAQLTAYCRRMLGSAFDAEDAVQETFLRAWRGLERFDGRAALSSWLYRIATNVCVDTLAGRERRAQPMDLTPEDAPESESDPAEVALERETVRLAFVAALQHLPPRQRAVLILCEVLRWRAAEVAELLGTSVASVTSALQRARATLAARHAAPGDPPALLDREERARLARYVSAFERHDIEAFRALLQEDAARS